MPAIAFIDGYSNGAPQGQSFDVIGAVPLGAVLDSYDINIGGMIPASTVAPQGTCDIALVDGLNNVIHYLARFGNTTNTPVGVVLQYSQHVHMGPDMDMKMGTIAGGSASLKVRLINNIGFTVTVGIIIALSKQS